MTNEQKLTKLLQIAIENDWKLLGIFNETKNYLTK